jgi:hypothetical protein
MVGFDVQGDDFIRLGNYVDIGIMRQLTFLNGRTPFGFLIELHDS